MAPLLPLDSGVPEVSGLQSYLPSPKGQGSPGVGRGVPYRMGPRGRGHAPTSLHLWGAPASGASHLLSPGGSSRPDVLSREPRPQRPPCPWQQPTTEPELTLGPMLPSLTPQPHLSQIHTLLCSVNKLGVEFFPPNKKHSPLRAAGCVVSWARSQGAGEHPVVTGGGGAWRCHLTCTGCPLTPSHDDHTEAQVPWPLGTDETWMERAGKGTPRDILLPPVGGDGACLL